ncbi:hypothetical protein IE4803_PB00341 (plasmid) [Rhizobium etli bv. phaseoli str. IE4803]|nr:hypothetical protein IE4803_PB00341 [Rhizobium etli bv. phaseoli str. IE4803]ARQ60782.1 hypothetical protein Kim5_PA00314 [Rhizobium sp. Kim5]
MWAFGRFRHEERQARLDTIWHRIEPQYGLLGSRGFRARLRSSASAAPNSGCVFFPGGLVMLAVHHVLIDLDCAMLSRGGLQVPRPTSDGYFASDAYVLVLAQEGAAQLPRFR